MKRALAATLVMFRAVGARMQEDLDACLARDPAARSTLSVALTSPGMHAVWLHRIAHRLWKSEHLLSAELCAMLNRHVTGVEIHPGAELGRRVVIDHGMGVVIGETARVGDDCLLYKGAVLGGRTLRKVRRHPQLGAGVTVGSNACVLGFVTIGDGARIGACSVVLGDVAAGSTVVGVPAREVRAPLRAEAREVMALAPVSTLESPLLRLLQSAGKHGE